MQFAEILKGASNEGKEKHVPFIEVTIGHGEQKADLIHVMVGKETPHPNTLEHHIAWVEVFGVRKDNGLAVSLGRAVFEPSYTAPNVSFHAPHDQFKAICALAYCNIHGLWQNCIDV